MIVLRGWGTERLIAKGYGAVVGGLMKDLIQAIQTALRTDASLSYIADANIFITADENLLPMTIGFPAIGLKDGSVRTLIEDGADWERTLSVDIIIYQLLESDDISIVGQANPKIYGVLEISEDVHSVLYDNKFSNAAIEVALPVSESATMILGTDDIVLVTRSLTYNYRIFEVNP